MVLLDNIILFTAALAVVAFLIYLSTRTEKNFIFSIAAAVIELLTVILLLFKGADIEELFLTVVLFGAISATVYYYGKPKGTNVNEEEKSKEK